MNHSFYGKKQYDNIIKFRAIETNNIVVKAANFGFSMIINTQGVVTQKKMIK